MEMGQDKIDKTERGEREDRERERDKREREISVDRQQTMMKKNQKNQSH